METSLGHKLQRWLLSNDIDLKSSDFVLFADLAIQHAIAVAMNDLSLPEKKVRLDKWGMPDRQAS